MMTKFVITIISMINMIKFQDHIHENEQNYDNGMIMVLLMVFRCNVITTNQRIFHKDYDVDMKVKVKEN